MYPTVFPQIQARSNLGELSGLWCPYGALVFAIFCGVVDF